MASKELMSVVKEEVSIPIEVLEILGDFKELITGELPNDFPPTRDKCQMGNVVDKLQRVKIFNVDIYKYRTDEALYQNENLGSSSSDVEETNV